MYLIGLWIYGFLVYFKISNGRFACCIPIIYTLSKLEIQFFAVVPFSGLPMIMLNKLSGKKKILIADDDHSITQMLSLLLQTRGFEVHVAGSGKQAIDASLENTFDLILLDLVLPDMEGFEVCRRLKQYQNTQHIPIIILSAKYLFEDKVEGLYLGADDYLTKPFEHEELFARMDAVMRRGVFFNGVVNDRQGGNEIILELRKIIDEELITPFFQPIYYLKPFKLFGLECLTRPNSQSMLANPELLFKAALQFGLYSDLEMLSWRKALQFVSRYLFRGEKIFLNCNPYLVEGPQFHKIKSIFEQQDVRAHRVVLEITERSAITDYKAFYHCLNEYRKLGFGVAVDDVGGGYSSLESIVETRPDIVKIDRHIISDLKYDSFKRSIVKFVVSFCKENNITSIAEGVESLEDLQTIMEMGVDAAQGYFLYRPSATIDIADICRTPAVFSRS